MATRKWKTSLSSSGKQLEYAVSNHVAFFDKELVDADFHPLMDFLKISPVSYALTASPTIYAEIVQEMWTQADCTTKGEIKFTIKGNSYILTSSLINEALHLPNSDFEKLPTNEEIIGMMEFVKYASKPWQLSNLSRSYLRKEWSYFFDTLTRVFTRKCSGYNAINVLVQKIAYSLMYGRTLDIGALLLNEFSTKLGGVVNRSKVVYFARFLMIIANYFCKELSIDDRAYTLPLCLQNKGMFSYLVTNNLNAEVEFVLPEHIRVQLSDLSSSPAHTSSLLVPTTIEDVREGHTSPAQVAVPSQSESGTVVTSSVSLSSKRKKITSPTIKEVGNEEIQTENEVNPPRKKKDARQVKLARSLFVVDQEIPPVETRDGVPPVELPLSSEEEQRKYDLLFPPAHAQEAEDRQHLMKAASVLKSQLVARITSYADKLKTEDMINLANKCYNTLEGLGDDYTSFCTEVNKIIAQHQELASAAKKKDNWNEWNLIKARYVHQVQFLCEVKQNLSSAQDKLSTAKTVADSLKLEIGEMKIALLKHTEELHEAQESVKTLKVARDQCEEARSVVEAELGKLDAENEEARVAFKAINDRYNAANKEFDRMSNHLLDLVRK